MVKAYIRLFRSVYLYRPLCTWGVENRFVKLRFFYLDKRCLIAVTGA